jgi:hypothetical protein
MFGGQIKIHFILEITFTMNSIAGTANAHIEYIFLEFINTCFTFINITKERMRKMQNDFYIHDFHVITKSSKRGDESEKCCVI